MREKKLAVLLVTIPVVLLSMSGGSAPQRDELSEEHLLSTEFQTPHTAWAKPYAGGKVRALFFLNIGYCGTVPREAVELKQRFDLEAEAVFWAQIVDSPNEGWHGGAAGLARMKRLLERTWDCFVFIGLTPDRLPVEEQYHVLEAVTKGAGLVLVGVDDPRVLKPANKLPLPSFLKSGVPFVGLPFVRASVLASVPPQQRTDANVAESGTARSPFPTERLIALYQVKSGRGVRLPARPNIPYRPGWETEYDYWQSLLGRAILWAAGRAPTASVSVTTKTPQLDRAALPRKDAVVVSWGDAPTSDQPSLCLTLRGDDGFVVRHETQWSAVKNATPLSLRGSLQTTAGQISLPIPSLPAGQYYVDAIMRGRRGVVTWASGSFAVTCSRAVKEIALAKPSSEVGGQMSGKVLIEGQPPLAKERVRVDLCDRRNRVLMRHEAAVVGNAVAFTFPVKEWLPMIVRVEATLLTSNAPAARSYTDFNVTKRNRGQFNFLVWDYPRDTLAAYAEESLARLGMTLQLSGGTPPRYAQAYDVAQVPYTTRILSPHDDKGIMQPCCWNDEEAISKHVAGIVSPYQTSRQSGVFVYSLGDEGVTRGSCLHPACLAAFRKYLRDEYKTIDALNASWGASYATFDEVVLDPPNDDNAAQAKAQGNYPRWYDRQAFQCTNFTRLCQRFVDAFRKLDPQARVGFEGSGRFDDGDDYDRIVRTNGFWSPYPGLGDEVIRSIAPRDFPRANWMGYTKDADSLLSKYWRMVTRGCDSVWWWRWDGVGRFHGFLAPHLGPYEATRELVKDTQVVRDGLGTLLIRSTMLHDGIAFVYSMPSAYATRVEKGPEYGHYAASHEAWSRTVRELGLQYRYVTDRMLRRSGVGNGLRVVPRRSGVGNGLRVVPRRSGVGNGLRAVPPSEFKVVILSRMEAMSAEEAAVLRRFVEKGGTLIADVRPGIFDGHCKLRNQGALDDVFGITRTGGNVEPVKGAATISDLRIANVVCDPAVRLAGGTAGGYCGQTPLVISHTYGKGRAILLNFTIVSFPALWAPDTPRAADRFLARLLAGAGVEPQVRVLNAKGERERNVEVVRWINAETRLLALFREAGEGSEVRVVLDGTWHVYGLRHRQYLGQVRSVRTKVFPGRATFFALMPYVIQPPRLSIRPTTLTRGKVGSVNVRVDTRKGQRAVLLTATTPEGKEADWLRRVVMVPPNGVTVSLPVAFNDPQGKWALRATELFSNKTTTVTLTVR